MTDQTNKIPYPDPVSVKRIYYEEEVKELIVSVLEEVENKWGEYSDDTLGERKSCKAVSIKDIQSIKNRYK